MSINGKPFGIALLGVNERDRNRLELFIDHHWTSNCLLVADQFADLSILDLDSLHGKKVLQQQQECYPNRPLIVLSVHDTDIDGVTRLRKPLSGDLLKNAIDNHMSALAQQASAEEAPTPEPELEPDPELEPEPELELELELELEQELLAQKRLNTTLPEPKLNGRRIALPDSATQARLIHGSCGSADSIEFDNPAVNSGLYYDPSALFQQTLKGTIEQSRRQVRPLRLNLPAGKYVALLPESNLALTNLSDSKLRPRCLLPVKEHQIRIDAPSKSEIRQLQTDSEIPQDIDGLLWKVSLWSARGRLPLGTKIDTNIELRQWPNFTRLLAIPQFLRIAALWAKTPSPLGKTAELLNIEARYVCAFFSACYALELTQVVATPENQHAQQNNSQQTSAPKSLLRRILRRLRVE